MLVNEALERDDSSLLYIAFFVLVVHLTAIGWSWMDFQALPLPKKAQKLAVKTVSLTPKSPAKVLPKQVEVPTPVLEHEPEAAPVQEEPKLEPKVEPKEVPKVEVQPKPVAKTKVEKKKPTPIKKPVQKVVEKPKPQATKEKPKPSALDAKKKKLLAQAQESIAKIDRSSAKISAGKYSKIPELKTPTIALLEGNGTIHSAMTDGEIGYRDELASRLKLLLKLPEVGQVKVKLTLNRVGKFVKLVVVSSESAANRKYIEKTLPTLTFPSFGNQFGNVEEYAFSITLSSDI